jgi:hypothetical protein
MKTHQIMGVVWARWTVGSIALLLGLNLFGQPVVDLKVPTLQSGTETYSNVTVYGQTETELFISHARGLENIKISSLDEASLRALGLKTPAEKAAAAAANSPTGKVMKEVQGAMGQVKDGLAEMNLSLPVAAREPSQSLPLVLESQTGLIILAIFLAVYLFTCYCLRLICLNAGTTPGALIWFPVLQVFPLLRAAQMSGWCFLLFLIPIVNLGASLWWCLRIAQACGKGTLTGILLFLPITGIFAFFYLAFSKGNREEQTGGVRPPRMASA